jgi:hypothetical protein
MDINRDGVKFSTNLLSGNLSDIKAYDWFSKINTSAVSETEQEYIEKLLTTIALNNAQETVTFSDLRLIYVATKLLINNGMSDSLLPEYGLNEYLIYFAYLTAFYDVNVEGLDEMKLFITYMLNNLHSSRKLSPEENKKLVILANNLLEKVDNEDLYKRTPDWVITAIQAASKMEVGEVVTPIDNSDVQNSGLEEREPEVKGESTEGGESESQIKELQDAVETFQFLIEAGASEEEVKELQEAVETFQFLIETLGTSESKKFAKGGEVEKFANGGKTLDEIWDKYEIADQYEGRKPEDIWARLTPSQRRHLLTDHANVENNGDLRVYTDWDTNFDDLEPILKKILRKHFAEGQYAKGGEVSNELVEYVVPTYYVSSLINGDDSGLEDEDIEKIDKFIQKVLNRDGNALFMLGDKSEESDFSPYNDIDNLGSDVTTLYIRPSKNFATGGEVEKKNEKWKKFVLENSSWFDDETENEEDEEILLTTRRNGNTAYEEVGEADITEAKEIIKKVVSKFPETQYKIERVDEYVYLYLRPSKTEKELEEEAKLKKKQTAKLSYEERIVNELGVSKEKAAEIVKNLSKYPKEYYENNKDKKTGYNNAFRVLYTSNKYFNNLPFNDSKEVFKYITNPSFTNSFSSLANPIIEVLISLYGWDCLRIKYDTNGFPFFTDGTTNYSAPRAKTLLAYPFLTANIESSKDLIDNVNKAVSDFIKSYEIVVLEIENKKQEPKGNGKNDIQELKDAIETFEFLIQSGATKQQAKELKEAKETFQFLMDTLRVS